MKFLGKYWKVLLALILVIAAVFFYFDKYLVEKTAYELLAAQLQITISSLQKNIDENMQYADIQDELDDARAELEASRLDLYEVFPVDMLEEDQIMYVLHLETVFKEEIFFSFNQPAELISLNDGSDLQYLELVINYKTSYQGFKDMVDYLSTDSRVASVRQATIDYDVDNDVAQGLVQLWLYLMDSDSLEYVSPDVAVPETGKENIFEPRIVWVTKNGSEYHTDPSCGNMKDPAEITLEEAKDRGLSACAKCYITVWVEEYGSHYHIDSDCSYMKDPYELYLDKAITTGRIACPKCCVSGPITEYVMVWVSKNSPKYHSNSSCSNMHSPYQVSLDLAEENGRTRCSECY